MNFPAVRPQRLLWPACHAPALSHHSSQPHPFLHDEVFWKQHIIGRTCSPHMYCLVLAVMSIRHLMGAGPPLQGKPLQDTLGAAHGTHRLPSINGHFEPIISMWSLSSHRLATYLLLSYQSEAPQRDPTSVPSQQDFCAAFLGSLCMVLPGSGNTAGTCGNQDKILIQENMYVRTARKSPEGIPRMTR